MSDVFVSYSRRDRAFVAELVEILAAAGRDVWLDVEAIEDAELFPEALRAAIEACSGVLFVISPASAASPHCRREVAYAVEYGKRIVPVVCEATPGDALPEAVATRNWIVADRVADAAERAGAALDRDLEHARAHAAWLGKARAWADHGEDRAYVLRGSEQAAAESWLRDAAGKDPVPTALHHSHIEAGRLPTGDVTLAVGMLAGAVELAAELGTAYADVRSAHDLRLREVWRRHGGLELDGELDGFAVAFADPARAVAAAGDAQRTAPRPGLEAAIAVHSGSPQLRDGRYFGPDVQYATRLGAAARRGQTLLSATTFAAIDGRDGEELGEHALVDFPSPQRLYHLVVDGRHASDFPPPRTLEVARTNLPSAPGELVGREDELAQITERLRAGRRLLTLTGVGGSGKTRLAIAAGHALLDDFANGVFLVSLAPVAGADGVEAAIATAVGAPEGELAAHLRDRTLLIVVDNMEHVLAAAPLLASLLEGAPGVRMLVTSQAPLRIRAEELLPLGPLAAAEDLFADRARAAGYDLADADAAAVAELCDRLGRLPLAIELAAARARLGGPARVLAALERGLDALGTGPRDLPERQRGLRAALDWTVSLLGEEERSLYAALGAFAEAWTIEQLEQMLGDELDVWEATAALMDFSLVTARGDGRLTMAETVRAHARATLVARGEEAVRRRSHAELVAAISGDVQLRYQFDFLAQMARTRELRPEIDAAVQWAATADPELHRRVVACLGSQLYYAGGIEPYVERFLALAEAESAHKPDAHTWRVHICGTVCFVQARDVDRAIAASERALACAPDLAARAVCGICAALFMQFTSDPMRGVEILDPLLAEARAAGDADVAAACEAQIAAQLSAAGNFDAAESRLAAITEEVTRTDFPSLSAYSCWADCALVRGDSESALERYALGLRRTPLPPGDDLLLQVNFMAAAFAGIGRAALAVELLAGLEADEHYRGLGGFEGPLFTRVAELVDGARARLSPEEIADAERRGRGHDAEELGRLVLTEASVAVRSP